MVETRRGDRFGFTRSVSIAVVLHAGVLAVLALVAAPLVLNAPVPRVVTVDLIPAEKAYPPESTRPEAEAPKLQSATVPSETSGRAVPQAETTASAVSPSEGEPVTARDFYAANILADPSNGALRRNFRQLASSEQLIQLCNIEALEQLGHSADAPVPDAVVGYAFDDLAVDDHRVVANGGAYRQHGQWYRVRFDCTSNGDVTAVTAFDYTLGDLVPPSQWEAHFLNANDEGIEP